MSQSLGLQRVGHNFATEQQLYVRQHLRVSHVYHSDDHRICVLTNFPKGRNRGLQ